MAFLGVYGHVNLDHILLLDALPKPETTVPVRRTLVRLGGTGGNIARAAAALGVPTALAACVGDDFLAEHRRQLESGGIDLADLRHVPGSTPKVWLLSVPGGQQSAIIDQGVMADGVPRPKLDLAWLQSDWVHLTTGAPDDWLEVARQASEAGKSIAADPAQEIHYRWTGRNFERLLEHSDLFFCNASELEKALSLFSYGAPEQFLDHTERIIVTRGKSGVDLYERSGHTHIPACPLRGPVRDTTGAGDAFRAGVYAGLHQGRDWVQAIRTGCATATLFLESGGERFPSGDDVQARLVEWGP